MVGGWEKYPTEKTILRIWLAYYVGHRVPGNFPCTVSLRSFSPSNASDMLCPLRAGHVHTFVEEFERDGEKLLRTTVELRLRGPIVFV